VEAHARFDTGAAQTPGEAGGVDDRGRSVHPQATVIRRRGHLAAHRIGIEHVDRMPVVAHCAGELGELLVLPECRRNVKHSGALEPAIDVVLGDGCLDRVEVLEPHAIERVQLVRETTHAVGETVREAGVAEAAVAAGRCGSGAPRFEDHDLQRWPALFGEQSGPEAGEPGADDRDVAVRIAIEWRRRLRRRAIVEPEHLGRGITQRGVLRGRGHGRHLGRVRGRSAER
jgi:hypothetical protein